VFTCNEPGDLVFYVFVFSFFFFLGRELTLFCPPFDEEEEFPFGLLFPGIFLRSVLLVPPPQFKGLFSLGVDNSF